MITEDGDDCVLKSPSGISSNLRIEYDDLNNNFEFVTADMFKTLMQESFAGSGITVGNVGCYKETNQNGVYAIRYDMELNAMGMPMLETFFIVNAGDRTYSFIYTEVGEDKGVLADVLWDTLVKFE